MSSRPYRIGEVARRTGVAVSTLRAWERRYGVLEPERTGGGHRTYSERDVLRVRRMAALVDEGTAASDAAARVLEHPETDDDPLVDEAALSKLSGPVHALQREMRLAIDRFAAGDLEHVLDRAYAQFQPAFVLDNILLPVLRWSGDGWQTDPRAIAREHFCSNVVRPRLLRQVRSVASNPDRVCVAAAPDGEQHDLGLIAAASLLALDGWQVHFLGASTPAPALERAVDQLGANAVLVAATARPPVTQLLRIAPHLGDATVLAGGPGFRTDDALPWRRAAVHSGPLATVPVLMASLQERPAVRRAS